MTVLKRQLKPAVRLLPGDVVLNGAEHTVVRTGGMQGRKPVDRAPLMRVWYADGSVEVLREDDPVAVRR